MTDDDPYALMEKSMRDAVQLIEDHNSWAGEAVGPSAKINHRHVPQIALQLFQARMWEQTPDFTAEDRRYFSD
ncbi:MAG: hypothetical protein SVG88_11880 [Halobacteriales archaeon]|nr:hypothetical protein [Halobacteriales archaeon]